MTKLRKKLSLPALLNITKNSFELVKDSCKVRSNIKLSDCLMSGLAIFSLKYKSLLQFDQAKEEELIKHNLKTLYKIDQVPSDTYLRERLDKVEPSKLRKGFKKIFAQIQKGKELEHFSYFDGHYLLSLDGTGYFSSHKVSCESCCVKNHHDGKKTFYHNMVGAVLIHPDHKEVIPFPPEPIQQQDGYSKNDCEQNASKRLLKTLRKEHPHLKLIVVEDALFSNGPHIQLLQELAYKYIIGGKGYDYRFDYIEEDKIERYEFVDESGTLHQFRFVNGISLNATYPEIKTNLLEYWEIDAKGKEKHFSWITDLLLTKHSVYKIMKGGRARWKIENETFNTLKNQGYNFEHNYGHGYKHLSTNFAYLMMLAFLIDQTQQLCCKFFKDVLAKSKSKTRFWEKIRGYFLHYYIHKWEDVYHAIIHQKGMVLQFDTS